MMTHNSGGDGIGHGNGFGDGSGYGFGDGVGHGNGHGGGFGDGSGFGNGFGFGDGDGHGDGHGFGYGIGHGIGNGIGNGFGFGFGFGYGYGHGSGYGHDYATNTEEHHMETIGIVIRFDKGYIADPYWPEREELINIQKESGMNRARSEQRREDALKTYLSRIDMGMDGYLALERLAMRPWYRVDLKETGEIIIPSHQFYGALIEGAKACPASIRPCEPENIRSLIVVTDLLTGKTTTDGIFKRLVMPKSGTGQPLSNQRSLRMNPYIQQFSAKGQLQFWPLELRDGGKYLCDFLTYVGQRIGVGASRKMGWGRYTIEDWQEGA